MQKITRSQTVLKNETEESLCKREMVYLAGRPNGKTSILQKIIGELAVDDKGSLIERIAPRKSGDFEVVILPKVTMPHRDRPTISYFQRQIMMGCGIKLQQNTPQYVANSRFFDMMSDLYERKTILCIAFDNAELMPEKCFTMLKYLNEIRGFSGPSKGQRIGIASIVSGSFGKIRFPPSYLQHCIEIQVGKVSHDEEIKELIGMHFPNDAELFSAPALRRITRHCETTLQVIRAARVAIAERKRLRDTEISTETVDTVLSGMGLLKAA